MTKYQMILEVLNSARIPNKEQKAEELAKRRKLERVKEVYTAYTGDKEKAIFYYSIM